MNNKRALFEGCMRTGLAVDVQVNGLDWGAIVPKQCQKKHVAFRFESNKCPDLRVDDEAIACTLSFDSVEFLVYLPWKSVFAISTDDQGDLYYEDVPTEVLKRLNIVDSHKTQVKPIPTKKKANNVVDMGEYKRKQWRRR